MLGVKPSFAIFVDSISATYFSPTGVAAFTIDSAKLQLQVVGELPNASSNI
jgi:hypothetical protein